MSNRSRLLLLSGPGGSGTSTIAAATVRALAAEGRRPRAIDVAMSKDPAPSLATLLRAGVGRVLAGLGADPVRDSDWMALPAIAHLGVLHEVLETLADPRVDVVVVDCGPLGQARDLLEAPGRVVRLLDAALTPRLAMWRMPGESQESPTVFEGLSDLRNEASRMQTALEHPDTLMRLVTMAEESAVARTLVGAATFPTLGVGVDGVVVTRCHDPAGGWPEAVVEAQAEQVRALVAGLGSIACWTSGAEPRPAPVDASALGPLSSVTPLSEQSLILTSRESDFTLDVPVSRRAAGTARAGRCGDDLVIRAGGVDRWLALPPVLRRCHAVDATRTEHGLRVRFTPDGTLWRAPAGSGL